MKSSSHQFAFYTEGVVALSTKRPSDTSLLTDPELVYRLGRVLRLKKDDQVILFNQAHHVKATIISIEPQKGVMLLLNEVAKNNILTPRIHWLLPLMKREAFEEALYSLTEMGASSIQPIVTAKIGRIWLGEKERERCKKIMKAAAEQSKQFIIPQLHTHASFKDAIEHTSVVPSAKLFFDAEGIPFKQALENIDSAKSTEIVVCSGPEGDLTYDEKDQLKTNGFIFSSLTPTILRAQQAVAVGLGALRSLLV